MQETKLTFTQRLEEVKAINELGEFINTIIENKDMLEAIHGEDKIKLIIEKVEAAKIKYQKKAVELLTEF